MKLFLALPDEVAVTLRASVRSTEPLNSAIKQRFAEGRTIADVEVKRLVICESVKYSEHFNGAFRAFRQSEGSAPSRAASPES